MQDPWVQTQLQQDVALYTLNRQTYTNGSMPQFLIGSNVTFGSMTFDQLHQKVTNQYPIRAGRP
jgi:hypothetical protein